MPAYDQLSKKSIRQFIRAQRQTLSEFEQQLAADSCVQNILTSGILKNSTNIAFYLSQDGELNLNNLITYCFDNLQNQNKKFYLPAIIPLSHMVNASSNDLNCSKSGDGMKLGKSLLDPAGKPRDEARINQDSDNFNRSYNHDNKTKNNFLSFIEYNKTTKFQYNKYNIPEPIASNDSSFINPQQLDVVFVPLVAFTKLGQRLGMGGGYYDRTFAFLANSSNNILEKPLLIGVAYDFQCLDYLPHQDWDIKLYGIATQSTFYKF